MRRKVQTQPKNNIQRNSVISTSFASLSNNADKARVLELQVKQDKIRLATIQAETAQQKLQAKILKGKLEDEKTGNWSYWGYYRNRQYYQRQKQHSWDISSKSSWKGCSRKRQDDHVSWHGQQNNKFFNEEFYEGELDLCYVKTV